MDYSAQRQFAVEPTAKVELALTTLVIGNVGRWIAEGRMLVSLDDVHFSDLESLKPELLDKIDPGLVLSPLFADSFDAIDIAQRLFALDYKGRYRVIGENLPNIDMIRQEVRAQAFGLDFDILSLPPNLSKKS